MACDVDFDVGFGCGGEVYAAAADDHFAVALAFGGGCGCGGRAGASFWLELLEVVDRDAAFAALGALAADG